MSTFLTLLNEITQSITLHIITQAAYHVPQHRTPLSFLKWHVQLTSQVSLKPGYYHPPTIHHLGKLRCSLKATIYSLKIAEEWSCVHFWVTKAVD